MATIKLICVVEVPAITVENARAKFETFRDAVQPRKYGLRIYEEPDLVGALQTLLHALGDVEDRRSPAVDVASEEAQALLSTVHMDRSE
jgi:hypothetical protein